MGRIHVGSFAGRINPNWAAVGALATVAATFLMLLAYAAPRGPAPEPGPIVTSTPAAAPPAGPFNTTPAPTVTTPRPTATTVEPTVTTRPPDPGPAPEWTLAPLPPEGCPETLAVLNTYYRTAGATRDSQYPAAVRARQDMMSASLSAKGAVYTTANDLTRDFTNMQYILDGTRGADYADAQARTNRDARTLRSLCQVG